MSAPALASLRIPSAADKQTIGDGRHIASAGGFAGAPKTGAVTDVEQLERHLLQRGVNLLAAGRHSCMECGRTPLVGELIHSYERERGIVCDLCRLRHRGQPAASELVRHSEAGHTVKLMARAA